MRSAAIRRIGEEKLDAHGEKRYPAWRWVVERTLAWLSMCGGLLIRDEQKAVHDVGLRPLVCAFIGVRRWAQLIFLRASLQRRG
jgi:hypothetical protein